MGFGYGYHHGVTCGGDRDPRRDHVQGEEEDPRNALGTPRCRDRADRRVSGTCDHEDLILEN